MKYLVTGADGFLGRYFLAALAERGIAARAMLQEGMPEVQLPGEPETIRADLLKEDTLKAATEGITHVIHLAALVHVMDESKLADDSLFFEVNVEGTRRLIEAAAAAGATHFLLMSTVKAMCEAGTDFDETLSPEPTTPSSDRSALASPAETPGAQLTRRGLRSPKPSPWRSPA